MEDDPARRTARHARRVHVAPLPAAAAPLKVRSGSLGDFSNALCRSPRLLALAALARVRRLDRDSRRQQLHRACGSNAPIVGSYTLKTVDSKPLPGGVRGLVARIGDARRHRLGVGADDGRAVQVGGSGNPNGDTLSLSGCWAVDRIERRRSSTTATSTTYTGTFTSTSITLTTKTATVLGYSK